uniref:Ribonuclease A-domain domain-containing protein n=1 Tax=Cyprinodon variegatus TaxID=28743 RepID=A0A3Q2CTE6_CYPVA
MDPENCNSVIEDNRIRYPNNKCKQRNTFISANEENVKSVCKGQNNNIKGGVLTVSKGKFDLVVCDILDKNSFYPNCVYKGSNSTNMHIKVSCKGGLPVHYEGDTTSKEGGDHK